MIRGVLLDVGGVFLLPHGATVAQALNEARVSFEPRFDEAHYVGVAAVDEGAGEIDDMTRYLRAYARRLGVADIDAASAVLAPLWSAPSISLWRDVLAASVEGLRALTAASLGLAIVSNSDGTVEEQLRKNAICQTDVGDGVRVTAILDSAVVGVAKPDPAIFEMALAALRLPPKEVAFVGDSILNDVRPAAGLGMRAFHFDPLGFCNETSHEHLRSLGELV